MPDKRAGILDSIAELSIQRLFFHPLALMALATIATVVLASMAWQWHRSDIIQEEEYAFTIDKLQLSSAPPWVPGNWLEVAFRDSRLHEVSILDTDATKEIASALAVQPWVKKIERVEKSRNKIVVELQYRAPVGMVQIGKNQFVPVDDDGVILDGSMFSADQVNSYLIISIPVPMGGPAIIGQEWPDSRIRGCAAIAASLGDQWKELGLFGVANRSKGTMASKELNKLEAFELYTPSGRPIIWGSVQGQEKSFEADVQTKLNALKAFVNEYGSLDKLSSDYVLDVRSGKVKQSRMSLTRAFDFKEHIR